MLPILGDEGHYNGRFPWVTAFLVLTNIVTYSAQVMLGPAFTLAYALVPIELPRLGHVGAMPQRSVVEDVRGPKDPPAFAPAIQPNQNLAVRSERPPPVVTLFTCLFLHADIFHLIGNMWFLLVFGRNVECAMNHGLFLVFYLACGVAAGVAHAVSDPFSLIPCIGASGAISGIMGAYIAIHPLNNIKIWLLMAIVEVPALIVIGIWLVLNYVSAVLSLESTANTGGVAYWAHLGGFGAGFVLLRTLILCLQFKRVLVGPPGQPTAPAKTEAADPFATFITIQTVRKMQEQQKQQDS